MDDLFFLLVTLVSELLVLFYASPGSYGPSSYRPHRSCGRLVSAGLAAASFWPIGIQRRRQDLSRRRRDFRQAELLWDVSLMAFFVRSRVGFYLPPLISHTFNPATFISKGSVYGGYRVERGLCGA